jgi:hypothetical protein
MKVERPVSWMVRVSGAPTRVRFSYCWELKDDKAASLTDEFPGIMVANEAGVAAIRASCKLLSYNHVPPHTPEAGLLKDIS